MEENAWVEAGVYEPAAPDAAERRELLAYLASVGVTVPEMAAISALGGLEFAAAQHLIGARQELTAAQLAERAGLSEDLVRRVYRAAGFPDPGSSPLFVPEDAVMFEIYARAAELFGEEALLGFTRVLGEVASRLAEAGVSTFTRTVGGPDSGRSRPVEVARAAADGAGALQAVPAVVDRLLRHHFRAAAERYRLAEFGDRGDTVRLVVGFVDLVGSTALADRLTPREFEAALVRFEEAAAEVVAQHGGRLVKLIGDEAMFVVVEAEAACEIVLSVVDRVRGTEGLGAARAGLAEGAVVIRSGDYFGSVVHLAARAVTEAGPGEVLVTGAVRDALGESGPFATEWVGDRSLRGVADPVPLYRLTRGGAAAAGGDAAS